MSIRFASQDIDFELLEAEKVKNWISKVIQLRGKKVGNISYLFCDDEYLLGVNQQYLNHDTYTDIITFDYVAADLISGDIMISIDRVGENASQFGVPFGQELHRVIIHGVLHLLGQGDKSDDEAAEMRRQEEESLALWNTMFPVEQTC
ncbi:MAG: rRNA maturation RNase YbeY [Bacteroidales bacterium]|nr:rRNA maturation RNase YbeY [Bacteroidales bacterium]